MIAARYFLLLISCGLAMCLTKAVGLDLSRLDAAEAELESLVADWRVEWEKNPGDRSGRELASSLQALGIVERQVGKPGEALPHLKEAGDLFSKHAPELLPDVREVEALTLQDLGELEEAETLLREVLEIRLKSGAGLKLAATCDHLALNLLIQGRYPEVAGLLDQAESATPADNLEFRARVISHRGRLSHTLGSYARATSYFEDALGIPFENAELRLSLESQLALGHLRLGRTEQARQESEKAAEDAIRIFANNPIAAAPYLNNLGAIALAVGDTENLMVARASFGNALEMLETALGPDHPGLIGPLNNLGVVEQRIGDYDSARIHLERAARLQAEHLPATHLRVAETERNLAWNSFLANAPDARDHVVRATRIGLDLLDRLILEGSENERLNFLERFDLVSLPCATGDAELIADVLISSKARLLDAMLAKALPAGRRTWKDIQASLAPDTVFVDTCRFSTATAPPVLRYGAIVIHPTGPPEWIPLGTDESLGNWLSAFHARLRWQSAALSGNIGPAPPLRIRGILRALEREFWDPLKLPADVQHVAYSPDGRLHFLPLPALLDNQDRPLSTRLLQITTVTSGRDLLNPRSKIKIADNPWTVLNISDFPKSSANPDGDPLLTLLSELTPMPGTRVEVDKLRSLAPAGSTFLSDSQATEHALGRLDKAPSVLHLGCHAFFLQQSESMIGMPVDFDEHSELLFSGGLVLYKGVQQYRGDFRLDDADDLLFPAEIARLPLRDTRLVTLSSCESGAGTPVAGEGLLGLRRAFSLAGAREVVVALWPVSDESTPRFMERFYQLAIASDRPAQALWQAQGEFLSAATTEEDFQLAVLRYAPFILSQNIPLEAGGQIQVSPIKPHNRWMVGLAAIPLLIFVINRLLVGWKTSRIARG